MQNPNVKKLFQEQVKLYSQDSQEAAESPLIPIFLEWVQNKKDKRKLKVCEFGGAGGILLDSISKKTDSQTEFYNAEIIKDYRKYQVNPKVKFCLASILDSKFPDNFFDCIIIRDVLHHLVGKNLKETKDNQKKALLEIKRLLKSNGLILIEELVDKYAFVARIIYWLSKINTKIGIRLRFLEISPHTIVAFLTTKELETMLKETFGSKRIIKKRYIPTNKQWQERLTHLGFSAGKLILGIKS